MNKWFIKPSQIAITKAINYANYKYLLETVA